MKPDFEVKNLADYSAKSLEVLLRSTRAAHTAVSIFNQKPEDIQELDLWCYKLRDALSKARKREQG